MYNHHFKIEKLVFGLKQEPGQSVLSGLSAAVFFFSFKVNTNCFNEEVSHVLVCFNKHCYACTH